MSVPAGYDAAARARSDRLDGPRSGVKFLHLCDQNWVGMANAFVEAHRRHGHEARLVTLCENENQFEEDICLHLPLLKGTSFHQVLKKGMNRLHHNQPKFVRPGGIPTWRPRIDEPSTIYLALGCDPCSEVAVWLQRLQPRQLRFVPAEEHPTTDLDRVRYEGADGHIEEGIAAIARALEHVHLAWAIAGCAMRLPVARQMLQTIVDATGGGKRLVVR